MKHTLKNKDIKLTDDEVKKIVKQNQVKEKKVVGVAIMSRYGGLKFQSTKTTFKEAVEEGMANLCDANLGGANLRGANLCGAELQNAKFYGRGGTQKFTKAQLPDFLNALGFQVEE